ncbi:MAG: type II toxin-antitoxin system RelE/ParE family toxin [Acidobacteriota bacterium]|nr:type II toxin-antitoxin system RelE/ParE family toxin [Acidobacteriota bacterium]
MFDSQPKEVVIYETSDGVYPFAGWLAALRDRQARTRIEKRLFRLRGGNPGDYKLVGEGIVELRIDYGPGYRLYLAFTEQHVILLLCGGDKSTQVADIKLAQTYWQEYQERIKQ